jgi:hypothetical protein
MKMAVSEENSRGGEVRQRRHREDEKGEKIFDKVGQTICIDFRRA